MPFEYDLILKPDVNTQGHTQWYYFSVSNMIPGVKYKFNIINLLKPNSLYNSGMQPVVYSTKAAEVRWFLSCLLMRMLDVLAVAWSCSWDGCYGWHFTVAGPSWLGSVLVFDDVLCADVKL